jgi:hypothetical protein
MATHCNFRRYISVGEISATARRLKYNPRVKQPWNDGDIYKVYDEVVKILPDMTFTTFDDEAQWRTIFHEDFIQACNEIAQCMAGV